MTRRGWHNESYRHYLAAKGISTARKKYFSKFGDWIRGTGEELRTEKEKYYKQLPVKEAAILRTQRNIIAGERVTPLTVQEQGAVFRMIGVAGKGATLDQRRAWLKKQKDQWETKEKPSVMNNIKEEMKKRAATAKKAEQDVAKERSWIEMYKSNADIRTSTTEVEIKSHMVSLEREMNEQKNAVEQFRALKKQLDELETGEDAKSMQLKAYEDQLMKNVFRVRNPSVRSQVEGAFKRERERTKSAVEEAKETAQAAAQVQRDQEVL